VHNKIGKEKLHAGKRNDKIKRLLHSPVYRELYQCKVNVSGWDIPDKVGHNPDKKSKEYHRSKVTGFMLNAVICFLFGKIISITLY
jgi:hypothetical protein